MLSKVKSAVPFTRLSGIGALGFAALAVLANVVAVSAGQPLAGAGIDEVRAFFGTRGAVVGISSALVPLAWVSITVFGAGAVAVLRRSESGRAEAWSLVGLAGVVLQTTAFAGVVAIRLALTTVAGNSVDATAGLWALHDALFTLNGTFLAIALVGLSMAGRRSGLIRRWHATLGLVAAALLFASATISRAVMVGGGPFGLLGLVGWLGWAVWMVAYGLTLIRLTPSWVPTRRERAGGPLG